MRSILRWLRVPFGATARLDNVGQGESGSRAAFARSAGARAPIGDVLHRKSCAPRIGTPLQEGRWS
jgi:hypothetical protein